MLCNIALMDGGALLRVVHIPTFYKSMDRVYKTSPENYENAEDTFLPLLYAVLALGSLFTKKDTAPDEIGYGLCIDKGFKYFRVSRQLLDIADCRDLTSLQAIIFMIQFLQSSTNLSSCYPYIGVAMRSALRMGLHQTLDTIFSPIEAETRKRLFWTIHKMDIYVGAMLGLPTSLNDRDIDQDCPAEVDDEYITETGIGPMPEGKLSVLAASNAHTKIVLILAKIEHDLKRWLNELPMELKSREEAPLVLMRYVNGSYI